MEDAADRRGPPITIVDPRTGIVLVGEGATAAPPRRRRRRPRWVLPALAAAVAVALVSTVTAHLVRARGADHQALADVALTTTLDIAPESASGDGVSFGLRNDGPDGLVVLSARLDAPGYGSDRRAQALVRYGILTLTLPNTPDCAAAAPVGVVVSLRTATGARTTRTVALDSTVLTLVSRSGDLACHRTAPSGPLAVTTEDITPAGTRALATVSLLNTTRDPLTVLSITPAAGLEINTNLALPRPLTPVNDGNGITQRTVTLELNVSSCRIFKASGIAHADRLVFAIQQGVAAPTTVVFHLPADVVTVLASTLARC